MQKPNTLVRKVSVNLAKYAFVAVLPLLESCFPAGFVDAHRHSTSLNSDSYACPSHAAALGNYARTGNDLTFAEGNLRDAFGNPSCVGSAADALATHYLNQRNSAGLSSLLHSSSLTARRNTMRMLTIALNHGGDQGFLLPIIAQGVTDADSVIRVDSVSSLFRFTANTPQRDQTIARLTQVYDSATAENRSTILEGIVLSAIVNRVPLTGYVPLLERAVADGTLNSVHWGSMGLALNNLRSGNFEGLRDQINSPREALRQNALGTLRAGLLDHTADPTVVLPILHSVQESQYSDVRERVSEILSTYERTRANSS